MRFLLLGLFVCALWTPVSVSAAGWEVYTNAENVRGVVPGAAYVAFPTSGGVRVYQRSTGKWRKWTMNDGLPGHNVFAAAFDPDSAERLWVLSGGWRNTDKEKLILSLAHLRTGEVEVVTELSPAPPAMPGAYVMFYGKYGLTIERERIVLATGEPGERRVYDRRAKTWGEETTQAFQSPSTVGNSTNPGGILSLRVDPARVVWVGTYGVSAYDRGTKMLREFPFGSDPMTSSDTFSGPYAIQFEFQGVRFARIHYTYPQGRGGGERETERVEYHFAPSEGRYRVIGRRRLSVDEYRRELNVLDRNPPDRLGGGQRTGFADDGQTLWFTTYNQPGSHMTGIARFDVATGRWSYPTSEGDLPANMVQQIAPTGAGLVASTTNGTGVYGPGTDGWRLDSDVRVPYLHTYYPEATGETVPDPRSHRYLQMMAREGDRYAWVKWWEATTEPGGSRWALGRFDRRTGETEGPFTQGDLAFLSVYTMIVQGNRLWLMGEDIRTRGDVMSPTGSPMLLRWDRTSGEIREYSNPPLMEAFEKARRSRGAYEGTSEFYEAAGGLWLWSSGGSDNTLLRFDPVQDRWQVEARGVVAVYPYADAMWVVRSSLDGGAGNRFYRWRPREGWLRVNMDPAFAGFMGTAFLQDGRDYWFGGIGVLKCRSTEVDFVPEAPLPSP